MSTGFRTRGTGRLRRRRRVAGVALIAPAVICVGAFFFVPLGLMFWMSLHDWPVFGVARFTGMQNFERVLQDDSFRGAAKFTLLYTVITTPILFAVGLGLALLMRQRRPGVGFFRSVYFIPVVIGMAASSYLWIWLVQPGLGPIWNLFFDVGLADRNTNWLAKAPTALIVVIVMVVWKSVGLQMILQMSGIQSIPSELEESARIDGASRLQVVYYIFLPLMRPTFALLLVFSVGGSLLAFDQFYIMTGGGPAQGTTTVVFSIYRASFVRFQLGYGAAISIVLLTALAAVSAVQLLILRKSNTE